MMHTYRLLATRCWLQFVNQFNETTKHNVCFQYIETQHTNKKERKKEKKKIATHTHTNLEALFVAIDILFLYGRRCLCKSQKYEAKSKKLKKNRQTNI